MNLLYDRAYVAQAYKHALASRDAAYAGQRDQAYHIYCHLAKELYALLELIDRDNADNG
jgi:hypothetical protein